MSAATKAVIRRAFEALNKHDLAAFNELIPNCVCRSSAAGEFKGEAYKQHINSVVTAFPDCHFTVEDQLFEGNKVVSRWTFTGTHKEKFMDIAATNKQLTLSVISIDRVVGGKILEVWEEWDALSMMRQLGVVPAPKVETKVAA